MASWYVDEGLQQFDRQWLDKYPGATIYHIGDSAHSTNPDVSQHAPDKGGSQPGDDKGEVDAGDYMPGNGVTLQKLRQAFYELNEQRDSRILYAICEDKVFSTVVNPWQIRPYFGKFHNHLHLSLNDKYESNRTIWKGFGPVLDWSYREVEGARLPEKLEMGMEDIAYNGWNHICRVQALLPILAPGKELLDTDGIYGAKTAMMVKQVFGGNGKILTFENIKRLHGLN
jgi:hypothetical protein